MYKFESGSFATHSEACEFLNLKVNQWVDQGYCLDDVQVVVICSDSREYEGNAGSTQFPHNVKGVAHSFAHDVLIRMKKAC